MEDLTAPLIVCSVMQSENSQVHLQFSENPSGTAGEYNPWSRAVRGNDPIGGEAFKVSLHAGGIRVGET